MTKGQIEIVVLEDGTLRIETGDMGSGPTHKTADDFLKMVTQLMGGGVEVAKTLDHHHHGYAHEDEKEEQGA